MVGTKAILFSKVFTQTTHDPKEKFKEIRKKKIIFKNSIIIKNKLDKLPFNVVTMKKLGSKMSY